MRIRTIKPEFWRSDDIAALDYFDRLLFIGLWSYVDDNGVGRDEERIIAADLFALEADPRETLARVSRGLQHLSDAGLVDRYTVEERDFLHITKWERHQKIDRPGKARYPMPKDGVTRQNSNPRESVARVSRGSRESVAPGTGEQGNRDNPPLAGPPSSTPGRLAKTQPWHGSSPHVVADAPTSKTGNRGTRLPEGWTPAWSQANLDVEAASGLTAAQLADQLDRFRDYWRGVAGAKGLKRDWDATWRNWVRRAVDKPSSRQAETDAWYSRAKARASHPNPLLSLLADNANPSDDPGRHALPPRSA